MSFLVTSATATDHQARVKIINAFSPILSLGMSGNMEGCSQGEIRRLQSNFNSVAKTGGAVLYTPCGFPTIAIINTPGTKKSIEDNIASQAERMCEDNSFASDVSAT